MLEKLFYVEVIMVEIIEKAEALESVIEKLEDTSKKIKDRVDFLKGNIALIKKEAVKRKRGLTNIEKEEIEISILDSAIYAYWLCSEHKEKKQQKVSY